MTDDNQITSLMAKAAMVMEDASADLLLDPLSPSRTDQMRRLASELRRIAGQVDEIRARRRPGTSYP